MATSNQKADACPISFVLHNQATGAAPVSITLAIRPEDLNRKEPSRLAITQTLGGAWADNFGPGVGSLTITGHTGWGQGGRPNGQAHFEKARDVAYVQWHSQRERARLAGLDPDLVKLIFADGLNKFEWVVAPTRFELKRNRSRPLLAQYAIQLEWLGDLSPSSNGQSLALDGQRGTLGIESIGESIKVLDGFVTSGIGSFLGDLRAPFESLVGLTGQALRKVQGYSNSVINPISGTASQLIELASDLSIAGANATHTVQTVLVLPDRAKAQLSRVSSAYANAFCVIRNIFKTRQFLPDYDDLYGASLCSSTAGGRPISRYNTESPFPELFPTEKTAAAKTGEAAQSLSRLMSMDPVLSPITATLLASDMAAVSAGVVLS